MNGIGLYQKDNFLDISEHKSRVRNGLSISLPDLKDFNTSYFRSFSNGDIDFDFPIKKISIDKKVMSKLKNSFIYKWVIYFRKEVFIFQLKNKLNNKTIE